MIKNLKKDFFMPDFSIENEFDFDVAGIDEAGRGPWAGPVVAGAVVIKNRCLAEDLKAELDDSKKLTAAKREKLYARLLEEQAAGRLLIGIGKASCREIDELNILQATFLAMRRAVEKLPVCPRAALVDGNRTPKPFPCACKTVVKGDSRSFSIAAASVVAKVYRDRLMKELAQKYPGYGFEKNAGYGTAAHIEGLKKQGVTPEHRRSYRPVREFLQNNEN